MIHTPCSIKAGFTSIALMVHSLLSTVRITQAAVVHSINEALLLLLLLLLVLLVQGTYHGFVPGRPVLPPPAQA
jgi:hypothetical protein